MRGPAPLGECPTPLDRPRESLLAWGFYPLYGVCARNLHSSIPRLNLMTQPHPPESTDEARTAVSTHDDDAAPEGPPPEPEPEPWTAQRVVEWNAYYDIYVVLGVLLLAFVGS